MKTIEIASAQGSLSEYAGHEEDLPLIVTDQGRPVAALVAVPNTDLESISLSTNPEFLRLIERSRHRQSQEGGLSAEEMRKRLNK